MAGLVSVPALLISSSTLNATTQQRDDDRRRQLQEKAEAETRERTAFTRNVVLWSGDADGWHYRNHNAAPIVLYHGWTSQNGTRVHRYDLAPCTEGTLPMPAHGGGSGTWVATKPEDATTAYDISQTPPRPVDLLDWKRRNGGQVPHAPRRWVHHQVEVRQARDGISPCA